MTQNIILHIGTFKTGSTSLQYSLFANNDILKKNNYYYGHFFNNTKSHSNLAYGLLKDALIHFNIFDKYKNHPRFKYVAQNPKLILNNIINDSASKDIILSHEALFADSFRTLIGLDVDLRNYPINEVNTYMRKTLFELLCNISKKITVVCYLRRQDLFIESMYNQICKTPWYSNNGAIYPFNKFINLNPVHLDYNKELTEWADLFGSENIVIKLYEKPLLDKGLINDFFTDILNIPLATPLAVVPETLQNNKISNDVLLYKEKIGYSTPIIDNLLEMYSKENTSINSGGLFDYDSRNKFLSCFDYSNKELAKLFFHRDNLFVDKQKNIPQINPLSYDQFVEITNWLIKNIPYK